MSSRTFVLGALCFACVAASHASARTQASLGAQAIRVLEPVSGSSSGVERDLREGRPSLRGFRATLAGEGSSATLGGDGRSLWPRDLQPDAPASNARAAKWVAEHLAFDGLLATFVHAGAELGAAFTDAEPQARIELLRAIGLPDDLLECFRIAPSGSPEDGSIVTAVAERSRAGASTEELLALVASAEFEFRRAEPRFHAALESGEEEVALVRLQLTRGSHWIGEGDGGSLDMARELVRAFPAADFLVSIEAQHAQEFIAAASAWPFTRANQLTLIAEPAPLSQWAQDNGKAGWIETVSPEGTTRRPATLVPRYASRGEDGSSFIPSETYVMEGLRRAGHDVVQSSLLFQGGDLLVVRDAPTAQRWLLMGEAELHRNAALGLSTAQVLAAFRAEFDVDRCVVLPAVSFHIDGELTARTGPLGERLAFVHDVERGTRIVLECGIDALERGGIFSASDARASRDRLHAGEAAELLETIGAALQSRMHAAGRFPLSLTESFSTSAVDSGVGNFQCFLLAVDLLASASLPIDQLPTDPHTAAYLRSLARRAEDRRRLHAGLVELGFELVPVPSLAEDRRGIHYLNGLHEPNRYLMPVHRGLYEPLDRAAREAFERRLGRDVKVHEVSSAESQRRSGAVHCSASVYPRL